MYWIWFTLLLLVNSVALLVTLIALPGNWIMVGTAALFVWLVPPTQSGGLTWIGVSVAAGLAVLGEIVELSAGAAGAAKLGARRRSVVMSMGATVVGSIVGSLVVPIPIVGTVIGAVGGGAIGAYLGAVAGEASVGTDADRREAIGRAAFRGRLLGTLAKLVIGTTIYLVIAVDAWT